jgi:predicted lipoprotein with Yx(FWY)xxD motif
MEVNFRFIADHTNNCTCETSSNLDYFYTCVSKSLFLLRYFNKETIATIGQTNKSGIYMSCKASTLYKYKYDHANQSKTSNTMLYTKLLRIQKLDYR